MPSTKTLIALGNALGVRPAEFLAAADSLALGPRLWSNPPGQASGAPPARAGTFFSFNDEPVDMDLDLSAASLMDRSDEDTIRAS
jgi:hypothetical protein